MDQLLTKRILLWCITLIAILSIGQMPPISQNMSYHHFADTASLWGIPNIGNVLSNIPFLFVGLYGLAYTFKHKQNLGVFYWGGLTFSVGVTLIAFGSGYYHWAPNNATLVWDRLPMTIGFMGLYGALCDDSVSLCQSRKWHQNLTLAISGRASECGLLGRHRTAGPRRSALVCTGAISTNDPYLGITGLF
ncbi:hypothetical protein [Psychrobium sp. 1_MG-2023]|uniref:hypothetical protein n=1 Tax=Psychrobium sp. 1_MG-2023 TaxID=3062624 RepID=UPI0012929975|nr:hypothetical protein [Psychrobium sp. 1_MG-2023]MDP2562567.1 hypothetical protein [Psychrobium sp. 1_MG-2023]